MQHCNASFTPFLGLLWCECAPSMRLLSALGHLPGCSIDGLNRASGFLVVLGANLNKI